MPRNEWDDDSKPLLSLDEMKYELAKRGTMPLRPDGSDVPYTAAEVPTLRVPVAPKEPPKPYSTSSDFAQVVADRLGISALPQALMAMGTGFASEVAKGMGYKDAAKAIQYEPTSRTTGDILAGLEAAPRVITGSHMGFGPTPELWATSLGRGINADDVRVLAKRGIETGRELRAIPEDFSNAQSGLVRQNYKGEPTYGARLQGAADDIGDTLSRIQARKSEYSTPMSGSVQVFSDMVPDTRMYAVKPTGGQLVKSVDPVTGNLRELENSSVAGISNVYEDIRKPTEGQGLINQYLRNFVNRPGIQNIWEDFNAKKVNEEFPGAPTPEQAREAFQVKYPTAKSRNERMTTFFDEFAALPEAQTAAADLGISIPTFEDYQKRIEAANQWGQKGFANYIQKYIGTKEDPALQLATQGITFKDPERLTEGAADALNYASPQGLREDRVKAGFNAEGEIQPFLKEKLTELRAVDDQLREMVTRRNGLYEQARTQGVDPASIPEYAELTNKLASKIAEKERITQQAENYKLGKSYETLADLAIEPRTAKDLKRKLTFAEKQLFPYLDKTPDEATLYDVNKTTLDRLGLTELAAKFMDDIVTGKIPMDQIGNVSIPKYIQESASARIAKEAAAKKDLAAQQRLLDTYLQEQVQSIPGDKIFGNAGVLEITNAMDEDTIRRHLSTDTSVLNHCVGSGGSSNGKHIPMMNPVTGETPKGSSGENTSYVRNIMKNGDKIASFRDLVTGKPVGTVQLGANGAGEFDIGYASGYENGRMQSAYSEALANYLNSISSQIAGAGDNLTKNGVLDKENATRYEMRDVTGLSESDLNQLNFDDMPRFLTRDAIVALNNERKSMMPSAQLNSEVATLNTSFAELLDDNQRLNFDLQNVDDDLVREELMDRRREIQSQLDDVHSRLNNLPLEDITNFARELINDVFPENKKTARARLQYLDQETPTSLRIQPRVYDAMREVLRDERDAIGAPLSAEQQSTVLTEWRRVSNEVARTVNGNMYNGRAVANNIRNNPDRYGVGEYSAQIIDGIARQVEENGIIDPRNAALPLIREADSSLPSVARERLNNLIGNALRGTTNEAIEQAIGQLRQYQEAYQNPPARSMVQDLTQNQRLEAIGELQGRIQDLEQRVRRQPLVNSARPQEQRQDLSTVVDNFANVIDEDYGVDVGNYVREALATINYDVNVDAPLYIARVRQLADISGDDRDVQRAMNQIADRLVQGEQANIAAAQAERRQLAPPEPREVQDLTGVLDQEMNRIRDNYGEEVYNTVEGTLTAINDNFDIAASPEMFSNRIRHHAQMYADTNNTPVSDALTHAADLLDRTVRENNAIDRRPPTQENGGLTPEYMTYLRTRLAEARTGEDMVNLERDFLQTGNPQGYSQSQIQAIEREIGQRSNEILRGNQPANQVNEAYRIVSDEVRSEYNTREGASVLETFATEPNARRDLANYIRDNPEEYSLRNYPQEIADAVRTRIATEGLYTPRAQQQNVPALRAPDNVGNIVQNLINQYPERNQIQALINDLEHGSYDELPTALLNADEIVIDDTVSQILEQLEEYRDSIPANQQALITGPQVADIVNRELDRQSDIRNLTRENLRSFRNDMTDVTDFTDPQDMINTLVSLREQYDDAGREGLSSAIGTVLRQIDAQVRVNRARAEVDRVTEQQQNTAQRYRDVNDAFAGIMYDNSQFDTPETLDALRALPQLIRRPGATRNSLGIATLDDENIEQLARIFEEMHRSRTEQFANNRLPPPEGRKRGGLIKKQSGGKIEPTSPSSSVDDRSKPVEPVRKIHNPDAPEFKDIFERERMNRSGGTSGGAGYKPGLRNPFNPDSPLNRKAGGSIQSSKNRLLSPNTDEMRYALLKGK